MNKILVFGIVMIFAMVSLVPLSHASYLNVTLYPSKKLAHITLNSVAILLVSYPNNSMLSNFFNGTSYNVSFSLSYNHPSDWAIKFMEGYIKSRYHNVTIDNMTVKFSLKEFANSTLLTVYKNTTIDLWITGIFNKTSNGIKADFSWRSLHITGNFDVNYNGRDFDLNDMFSDIIKLPTYNNFMPIINKEHVDTINYSALSKPLDQWNKIYDQSTNTTTFYYNASEYLLLNQTFNNINIKVIYDPSSTIITPGYAVATNNSIIVYPTSPNNYTDILLIAIAILAIIGIFAGITIKKRK